MKVPCVKVFLGNTKLILTGEFIGDLSREKEIGEREKEERSIEGSFTDHNISPLDCKSTVPINLNFKEGSNLSGFELPS